MTILKEKKFSLIKKALPMLFLFSLKTELYPMMMSTHCLKLLFKR